MKTNIEQVCEMMETILAHQPVIDVPYDKINEIAVALVKEGYGNKAEFVRTAQKNAVKQFAGKLKERIETAIDTYYNKDGGGYYLAEDVLDDIDLLIEEVQNGKDKD